MTYFPKATPESCGVPSECIEALITRLCSLEPEQEPHGFALLRHGKLLAEASFAPFDNRYPHEVFSVSKAFTSTAVAFAVQEGRFRLGDRIADFFPDKLPEHPQKEMLELTVRDLMRMGAGQKGVAVHHLRKSDDDVEDWVSAFLSTPIERAPGSAFGYNGFCSHMLAALVTKLSGQDMMDYLDERLFRPLGIAKPACERVNGVCKGSTGMRLTLEDMAKLGFFYLHKGVWAGKRLLPEAWFDEATRKQIDTGDVGTGLDWQQGYCYQFWRGRFNTFRFCGAYGQMCVVMPDLDALFVIQSGCDNDKIHCALEAFYETVREAIAPNALPENPEANARAEKLLASLRLADAFSRRSPAARDADYAFADDAPLRRLALRFHGESECLAEMELADGRRYRLPCGLRAPVKSVQSDGELYAGSACFPEMSRLECKIRRLGSPAILHLSVRYQKDGCEAAFWVRRGSPASPVYYSSIR